MSATIECIHPIINEWNSLSELEQYNMLRKNILTALKYYNRKSVFNFYEVEELIGEVWLTLQKKLNVKYIDSLAKRRDKKN